MSDGKSTYENRYKVEYDGPYEISPEGWVVVDTKDHHKIVCQWANKKEVADKWASECEIKNAFLQGQRSSEVEYEKIKALSVKCTQDLVEMADEVRDLKEQRDDAMRLLKETLENLPDLTVSDGMVAQDKIVRAYEALKKEVTP